MVAFRRGAFLLDKRPLLLLTLPLKTICRGFVVIWIGYIIARFVLLNHGSEFWPLISPIQFDTFTIGIAAVILQREGSFLGVTAKAARIIALVCGFWLFPRS